MKSPGEALRDALRAAALKPKDLAEAWGTTVTLVYMIMSGKSNMSFNQAVKAAELFGISLDRLAGKEVVDPEREAIAEMLSALADHFRKQGGEE